MLSNCFICYEFYRTNLLQSSNIGQAYVTSGGIGQTWIRFVIQVSNTNYVRLRVLVYGY